MFVGRAVSGLLERAAFCDKRLLGVKPENPYPAPEQMFRQCSESDSKRGQEGKLAVTARFAHRGAIVRVPGGLSATLTLPGPFGGRALLGDDPVPDLIMLYAT
jgi:hypothetical protein